MAVLNLHHLTGLGHANAVQLSDLRARRCPSVGKIGHRTLRLVRLRITAA